MANATAKVQMATTPWGDDSIKRIPAATTATYYPGAMIALNSSGNAVKCDDTAGIRFDGINANTARLQINSDDTLATMALDQSKMITVERPWRFTMKIASAVAGDEGKAVYALDDQTVAYSTGNSIQVGWVDQVLSATAVLIIPLYSPLQNVAVAGNTLAFAGTTGANTITFPDNLADALSFKQGSNTYLTFVTTDGSESTAVKGPPATAVTNAGGAVTITGGIGGATSGAGGAVTITGGAGTNNALGGVASLVGGAGQGSGAGAAAVVTGGAGGGTGAGGALTFTSGAGGGTSGAAGAINIAVGSATSANGAAVTITGGNGAGGTNAGGNINLIPGTAVSTGTPGEVQINSAAGLFEANWQQYLAASVPVSGTSYTMYLANRAVRVKAVRIVCSSSSTVPTVDVIKDTGTTAPGGGTSVLTGVATFSATANTVVAGTVSSTIATVTLAAGDRLALKWGGTVGSITGAIVSVLLVPC